MTGTDRKNENSAATVLDTPRTMAPIMVDPDLEVPGISARHWNRPMKRAVFISSSFRLRTENSICSFLFSTSMKITP